MESLLRKKRPSTIDNLTLPAPISILGMGVMSERPRPGK
jgi:hypothetical protein